MQTRIDRRPTRGDLYILLGIGVGLLIDVKFFVHLEIRPFEDATMLMRYAIHVATATEMFGTLVSVLLMAPQIFFR